MAAVYLCTCLFLPMPGLFSFLSCFLIPRESPRGPEEGRCCKTTPGLAKLSPSSPFPPLCQAGLFKHARQQLANSDRWFMTSPVIVRIIHRYIFRFVPPSDESAICINGEHLCLPAGSIDASCISLFVLGFPLSICCCFSYQSANRPDSPLLIKNIEFTSHMHVN